MKTSKNARISSAIAATAILLVVVAPLGRTASQSNEMWQDVEEPSLDTTAKRAIVPEIYRTLRLDQAGLAQALAKAPMEYTLEARQRPAIIHLPMPDGTMARFRFEESPVIEAGLAAKYPELKMTYRAKGIDDPAATSRFNWLPSGFHAIILSPAGTVLIDPYAPGNTTAYVSYFSKDLPNSAKAFECGFKESDFPPSAQRAAGDPIPAVSSGTTLRTYRLALACTHEFAVRAHVGGGADTIAEALAAEVAIMDRVNALFESDVSIHLNIIANNDLITYASNQSCNGERCTNDNDPYTNPNVNLLVEENNTNIASVIGLTNFDMGHVFSNTGFGMAFFTTPCGPNKSRATSGPDALNPAGSMSHVAHEMGHQFGAGHTFNSATSGCGSGGSSAYEPGSGATIMSYRGGCQPENLGPPSSLEMFHVSSLESIIAFSQTGPGNSCAAQTSTGEGPPPISGPGNFNIPKKTPFSLTASLTASLTEGTDAGDSVMYDWEEYDLGAPPPSASPVPNSDEDGNPRPIFRVYAPTKSGTRTFPSSIYILNNANVPPAFTPDGQAMIGEILPSITRAMTFKVVARHNQAIGGGISTATSVVSVVGPAGPFAVTAPNTAISVPALSYCTVRWNVTGTTLAPIHAANVKISLSTNTGKSFPTVLAASTANDGVESVLIPDVGATTTARIKVEAVGNIFFDISDTNFTITPVGSLPGPTPAPSPTPTPSSILAGTLSLPNTSISQSVTNFTLPVVTTELDAVVNLIGFQGDLLFDSSIITFQSTPVSKTGLTGGNWNVTGSVLPGSGLIRTLRILATSTDSTPLSGSGNLFNLNMTRVSSTRRDFTNLTWALPPFHFRFVDAGSNSYTLEFTPSGRIEIGAAGVIEPDL